MLNQKYYSKSILYELLWDHEEDVIVIVVIEEPRETVLNSWSKSLIVI